MAATTSSLLDQAHDGDAGAIASLLADVKLHGLTPEVAGPSLLVLAARAGDLEAVDSLLAVGLNVNAIVAQDTTPLITAVQSEHTEIVQSLLRHGADPNVAPPSGGTALQEACRHGLTDIATALLEHGADTEACADDDGVTALCYAFDANDVESARVLHDFRANANVMLYGMPLFLLAVDVHSVDFAKLLVETYGVDVNQVDRNGNTALMLATRRGWDDLVTYLAPRCNVNAVAAHGYSAVAIAAAAGNLALVHALYSVGAHLAPSKPEHEAPLEAACAQGHLDVVRFLVEHIKNDVDRINAEGTAALYAAVVHGAGDIVACLLPHANVNRVLSTGATYLCAAAFDGHTAIVEQLLANGADPSLPDGEGNTPLLHAVAQHHVDIVALLLPVLDVATVNVRNRSGETAVFRARSSSVLRQLLAAGANPLLARYDGCSVLGKAITLKKPNMVTLLLPLIDVNAPIKRTTALRLAVETRDEDVVARLLDAGANVDQAAENGRTALHLAAQLGPATMMERLLAETKCIDQTFPGGFTALSTAIEFGSLDVIQALLRHGANVHHVNEHGVSLLQLACALGRPDVVRVLLDAGADLDAHDANGWNCFIMAVDKGQVDAVRYLLPLVNPNEEIVSSFAPRLMAHNAAPVKFFTNGFRALHIAYDETDDPSMLRALMESPALEINATDARHGLSALHCACAMGLYASVSQLLTHATIDGNLQDKEGNTALHYASLYGHSKLVELLLDVKAPTLDISMHNQSGQTALMLAEELGHEAIAVLLRARP